MCDEFLLFIFLSEQMHKKIVEIRLLALWDKKTQLNYFFVSQKRGKNAANTFCLVIQRGEEDMPLTWRPNVILAERANWITANQEEGQAPDVT